MANRQEHLDWCKVRALEYVAQGDASSAWASMVSDVRKHEATENHPAIELGALLLLEGFLDTEAEMKKFIEGFN